MFNSNQEFELLDIITLINFALNITDVSNGKLMQELRKQDKEYLEEINRKIDILLERR